MRVAPSGLRKQRLVQSSYFAVAMTDCGVHSASLAGTLDVVGAYSSEDAASGFIKPRNARSWLFPFSSDNSVSSVEDRRNKSIASLTMRSENVPGAAGQVSTVTTAKSSAPQRPR